jgi:hypothetical protein
VRRITIATAFLLFALAPTTFADPITATLIIQVEQRCLGLAELPCPAFDRRFPLTLTFDSAVTRRVEERTGDSGFISHTHRQLSFSSVPLARPPVRPDARSGSVLSHSLFFGPPSEPALHFVDIFQTADIDGVFWQMLLRTGEDVSAPFPPLTVESLLEVLGRGTAHLADHEFVYTYSPPEGEESRRIVYLGQIAGLIDSTPIPEPTSILLVGSVLTGAWLRQRFCGSR